MTRSSAVGLLPPTARLDNLGLIESVTLGIAEHRVLSTRHPGYAPRRAYQYHKRRRLFREG